MDEEDTAGYKEPCAQCGTVNWGISDEGRFYCKSCHNVIERTQEGVDTNFGNIAGKVLNISKGPRAKTEERIRVWMICEGFQFILKNQADALLRLGVSPHFKDDVLCQLWRLYLQKSRQAYTNTPLPRFWSRLPQPSGESDSDSVAESSTLSMMDRELNTPSSTDCSNSEANSDCSGSVDAYSYLKTRQRKKNLLMNMRKTLALLHLALVWSREALTLSDLLRLVKDGHVPYLNAFELFPEEMKLHGQDSTVFYTESIPSHHSVHKDAQVLLLLLDLPSFPPISSEDLLHPALLSLRYLTDANLPDDLYRCVCKVMEHADVCDLYPILPRYDVQAAAFIIVTMKLIFGLDDRTEWELSSQVRSFTSSGNLFSFRRWFRLMEAALTRAQQQKDQDTSRKQWKPKNPIILKKRVKSVTMKKKRVTEQLQMCFEKLSSCPTGVKDTSPSSFRFCWGVKGRSDGPSLHKTKLDGVLILKNDILTPLNSSYWHSGLRCCNVRQCRAFSHYSEFEPTLPRSFVWLLRFFCFMLDVEPCYMFEEVLKVERKLIGTRLTQDKIGKFRIPDRKRTRSKSSAWISEEAED